MFMLMGFIPCALCIPWFHFFVFGLKLLKSMACIPNLQTIGFNTFN
jgi:hypothetical protein